MAVAEPFLTYDGIRCALRDISQWDGEESVIQESEVGIVEDEGCEDEWRNRSHLSEGRILRRLQRSFPSIFGPSPFLFSNLKSGSL